MKLTSDRIANLSPEKRARLMAMLQEKTKKEQFIQPRESDDQLPLSHAQMGMWLVDQMGEMNTVYNLFRAFRLDGPLRRDILETVVNEIIRRHESLRTIIVKENDQPIQKILPPSPLKMGVDNLTHLKGEEREAEIKRLCDAENSHAINLSIGPLLRFKLLALEDEKHIMLLNLHHIITDAHTSNLLVSELLALYNAFSRGLPSPLPELPIQYADFALWQRKTLNEEKIRKESDYWLQKLDGAPPLSGFPTDHPRPPVQNFDGGQVTGKFEPELVAKFKHTAQTQGVTLNMLLLATFKAFLYRYTQQPDLILSMAVANREQPGTEHLIGFLANNLCIRTVLDPALSFQAYLKQVRSVMLEAIEHKDIPFDTILKAVNPDRDPSHTPLFQIIFVYQKVEVQKETLAGNIGFTPYGYERKIAKTDLLMQFLDRGSDFHFSLEYASALFEEETMQRLMRLYLKFAHQLLDCNEARIGELPLLDNDEKKRLIDDVGRTRQEVPPPMPLHTLVERQTERTPDSLALEFEGEKLTYASLNARANQLAHNLINGNNYGRGKTVAVMATTSIDRIVAIIAVLKTGAAYLPIDETQGESRIEYILKDAEPCLLITESEFMYDLDVEVPIFALDLQMQALATPENNPALNITIDDVAYLIYTSGSTGNPKGVVVPHRGAAQLVTYQTTLFNPAHDRVLQFASIGFDAAVAEIFATLGMGATLCLAPRDILAPCDEFVAFINEHRISHTIMPPALLSQLREGDFPTLKSILSMGERCGVNLVKKWGPGRDFINGYGPTENAIGAAMYVCDPTEDRDPPLGPSLPHVQSYVLDSHLDLLPAGVPGELCLSGDGLAYGYHGKPALTAQSFLPDPYSNEPGNRLYKTGDKVRFNVDNTLAFLGRVDFQVKIRGFRIEPEEIDKACVRFGAVEEAVVDLSEDGQNLVAFVVPKARSKRIIDGHERIQLPNGMALAHHTQNQTQYLYDEIFDRKQYDTGGLVLKPGFTIFDVGANIGMFSLYANQVCPGGKIFAFEPMPPNFERLAINARLYGPDITLFNCALSDVEDDAIFSFYPRSSGGSGRYTNEAEEEEVVRTLIRNQEKLEGKMPGDRYVDEMVEGMFEKVDYEVEMRRISDIIREFEIDHIDLLKIDVEKSELDVLNGLDEEHWDIIDQITLEIHDIDDRLNIINKRLEDHGFDVAYEQDVLLVGTKLYNVYASKVPKEERQTQPHELPTINDPLFSIEALREHLTRELPSYMVPALYREMESLPLTTNGKVDRKALPRGEAQAALASVGQPIETPTQQYIAGLFAEVLDISVAHADVHFFNSGGHSLLATQVIAKIQESYQITLPLRALFTNATVAGLAALVDEMVAGQGSTGRPPLQERSVEERHRTPLSFAQQRLWVVQQMAGEDAFYNIPVAFRLKGELHVEALHQAFNHVVSRHEVLRTRIAVKNGHTYQDIQDHQPLPLDLSEGTEEQIETWVWEHTQEPFDLQTELPIRWSILKLAEEDHVIQLTMHHMVSDGWSLGLLINELSTGYQAFCKQATPQLPTLPVQYADYASWQRTWLGEEGPSNQIAYWQERLKDSPPLLELPLDHPRPSVQSFVGAQQSFRLSEQALHRLQGIANQQEATLFMTVGATLAALLARYCGQDDLCLGTAIANRDQAETRELIGFFVNTLVLRFDLSGEINFKQLLERVKQTATQAYENQDLPFEMMLDHLGVNRDVAHTPLFQVMYTLQHESDLAPNLPGLAVHAVATPHESAKFDLTVAAIERNGELGIVLEYNIGLFDDATITALGNRFVALLSRLGREPTRPLAELNLITAEESAWLLARQPDPGTYPDQTPREMFEAQVRKSPESDALILDDLAVSYDQLNRLANRSAHNLIRLGVRSGDRVCIWGRRGLNYVVVMMATAKAGAIYVPLDPAAPKHRLETLIQDVAPSVIVGPRSLENVAGAVSFVNWDDPTSLPEDLPDTDPPPNTEPDHAAYILFTSGTTGTPKGVTVTCRNIVSLVCGTGYFDPIGTIIHLAPPAFDASTFELWGALLHGGRCVVLAETLPTPDLLTNLIITHQVDTLWVTTRLFNQLAESAPEAFTPLRQVLTGGEQSSPGHFEDLRLRFPKLRLVHCYGPTEVTTFSTTYDYPEEPPTNAVSVSLGTAIDHKTSYVVDRRLNLTPPGMPGELLLGGAGLSMGYWGRPAQTAAAFVPNPFVQAPGERLYRSGDLVCYHGDALLFMGRVDAQIKLRGFRIETEEIRRQLCDHPRVNDAFVTPVGENEQRMLAAYLVLEGSDTNDHNELRTHLSARLPAYMVPGVYIPVERIPLKANGKVNRAALPNPEDANLQETYEPPSNDTEEKLVALWKDILQHPNPGVTDNFFELGGNSLSIIRLHKVLQEEAYDIPLVSLFEHTTIRALASFLTQARSQDLTQKRERGKGRKEAILNRRKRGKKP